MVVSVNFHGYQREVTNTDEIQVPILRGKTVTDLLLYLKTRYPDLPLSKGALLVIVNDKVSSMEKTLRADDKISFIPHIGGG